MKSPLAALVAGILLAVAPAFAEEVEEIRVALPETVDLVELQPGLQVVTDLDLELFHQDGAYWLRTDGGWFSSRRPLEGFQVVAPRSVPPELARLERGRYLHYQPQAGQRRAQRHVGAAGPAESGGVEVDAAKAKVAPRGSMLPQDRPEEPAPASAAPKPAPAAALPAPPAGKPAAQPPPAKKVSPAKKVPPAKKSPPAKKAPPAGKASPAPQAPPKKPADGTR